MQSKIAIIKMLAEISNLNISDLIFGPFVSYLEQISDTLLKHGWSKITPTKHKLDWISWDKIYENDSLTAPSRFYWYTKEETRTPQYKIFSEKNNGCARAL